MKSRLLIVAVVTGGLLVVARPMFPHHAQSYYDRDQQVTVSGTVSEYDFTNPHVQIHFDVKNPNGTVTGWTAGTWSAYRNWWRPRGRNSHWERNKYRVLSIEFLLSIGSHWKLQD